MNIQTLSSAVAAGKVFCVKTDFLRLTPEFGEVRSTLRGLRLRLEKYAQLSNLYDQPSKSNVASSFFMVK